MAWDTNQDPLNYLLRREKYYLRIHRKQLLQADDEEYILRLQQWKPELTRQNVLNSAQYHKDMADKFRRAAEVIAQYGDEDM